MQNLMKSTSTDMLLLLRRLFVCLPVLMGILLTYGIIHGLSGCTTANANQAKNIEASATIATGSTPSTAGRYVAHMFHHNSPLLWRQSQLSIYCPDTTFQPLVLKAFEPWAKGLYAVHPIQLMFVSTPTEADIIITLAKTLDAKIQWDNANRRGYTAALTKPIAYDAQTGALDTVTIEVATLNSSGLPQSTETIQRVVLHELGHALGLWGHSSNGFDVMSPNFYKGLGKQNTPLTLSENDVETIKALYQQYSPELETPSLTPVQKPHNTVASLTRQQAMMEASPSWQGYWELARRYRDANQPLQADAAYGKVLQLKGPNPDLYLERIQALQLAGMNTEALALLNPAPTPYQTVGRLTLEKAWLMVKLDRIPEARTLFDQALQQSPALEQGTTAQQVKQYL
jgi:predicted Zn-dependent protease